MKHDSPSFQLSNFKPTAPPIIQVKKRSRKTLEDSLKNTIPIKTARVAPQPFPIAQAAPSGISRTAKDRRKKTKAEESTRQTNQNTFLTIKNKLMLMTPNISPTLATTEYNHATLHPLPFRF